MKGSLKCNAGVLGGLNVKPAIDIPSKQNIIIKDIFIATDRQDTDN